MNPKREKAENLIYKVFDTLDKTGLNSSYYKGLFASMSDSQFLNFCKKDLPFRFHTRPFVIEPKMDEITDALKIMDVPLLEKVALPYLYKNKNNEPVWSHPAMVIYIHTKKMKQFITKKNSVPTNIGDRDMKTGLLTGKDKGGRTSDREMESLTVMGLDHTMKELSTWRADYMNAKTIGYQTINTTGEIYESDIPIDNEDSLSKNMLNALLVGSLINTNFINKDYMLPKTMKNKNKKVIREV